MDIVNTLLGALCACMQNPAVQEKLGYITTSSRKLLVDVENELEDLKARENDVLHKQEEADRTGKQLTQQIQRWLEKVQLHEKYITMNQMKDDYSNRGCLLGSCSLNCWVNYKIKQRAIKLIKEMNNLKTERDAFQEITETQSPRKVMPIPTSVIAVGNIIELNRKKVLGYLAEDNVSMVGIWGMGGVGKTTLLNEINNSFQGGDSNMGFKYVIYLVVSKEPQFDKLRNDVCKRLGLGPDSEKNDIFEFLKNKDFLLLLDDIWMVVDLPEELGIPLPHQQSQNFEDRDQKYKHKVIFTTRKDDVCSQMKAHRKVKVECLDREEAWLLFKQNVGEWFIGSNAIIEKLALKIMEKCSGLPLALKVIGRAMSNKYRIEEWEDMVTSLHKLDFETTIHDMGELLFYKLKLSYDNLISDTLRECFLCCAQWPEDARIMVSDLIEYWIGFGLIDGFGNIEEAFNKGYSLIGKLNEACLLDFERKYVEDCVKLHDVIRDMALWIVSECGKKKNKWIVCASDTDLSQSLERETGNWKDVERIFFKGSSQHSHIELLSSQNNDEEDQASVAPNSPRYPNLMSVSILNDEAVYWAYDHWHLNFFPHMPSLIYLNLSRSPVLVLPKEIRVLVNLQCLNISYTVIQSLPPELEELKELKYFIFRHYGIRGRKVDGLSTISKLPKLQVLDLFYNSCLEADDLSLLKRQVKSIGMHVTSIEALGLIKNLPTWNISLQGLRDEPILHFCDLSYKHGEGLMKLVIDSCDFKELLINGSGISLKNIVLQGCEFKQITWSAKTTPNECFPRLTIVLIDTCQLRSLSWALHLPCLRMLWVVSCSAMKELIDPAEMEHASSSLATFPRLRYLSIMCMPNLVSLSRYPLDFPFLSTLILKQCPKLKKLPLKASIVNNKFEDLDIDEEVWEGLEWEDTTIPSHLIKFFKKIRNYH